MSIAFESIQAGLIEAIADARGRAVGAKLHHTKAIDVNAIRAQLGTPQTEFASSIRVSVGTSRTI